jgi:hypothetical protein
MTTSRQPNIRSITTPAANTIGVTRVGSKLQSCYEDMLYKPVARRSRTSCAKCLEAAPVSPRDLRNRLERFSL